MRPLVLSICLSVFASACIAATPIEELAQKVEANEKHYENLELVITQNYQLHRRIAPTEEGGNPNALIRHFQDSETTWSLILVGSSFRQHRTKVASVPPEQRTSDRTWVYDGTTYRSFTQRTALHTRTGKLTLGKTSGLISDRPPSLTNLARPHMLLLEGGYPMVPLSIYLRGHNAVREYPNPGYFSAKNTLEFEVLEPEQYQGLQCRVVTINTLKSEGKRHHAWKLWLAEERNLIPVRRLAYEDRWSSEIPIGEAVVDKWQELRPGVWFPAKAHVQRYDSHIVQREARQQPSWRTTYEVESVSLEPQTTPETFTKLDFPPGTEVRIESDDAEE